MSLCSVGARVRPETRDRLERLRESAPADGEDPCGYRRHAVARPAGHLVTIIADAATAAAGRTWKNGTTGAVALAAGLSLFAPAAADAQPTPNAAETNFAGDAIRIHFSERLHNPPRSELPPVTAFAVTAGELRYFLNRVHSVDTNIVYLELAEAIADRNAAISISYTKPDAAGKRIKSHSTPRQDVESFTLGVANLTTRNALRRPVFAINGARDAINVRFDQAMKTSSVPAASQFTLEAILLL